MRKLVQSLLRGMKVTKEMNIDLRVVLAFICACCYEVSFLWLVSLKVAAILVCSFPCFLC